MNIWNTVFNVIILDIMLTFSCTNAYMRCIHEMYPFSSYSSFTNVSVCQLPLVTLSTLYTLFSDW